MSTPCFHCGLPIPKGLNCQTKIKGALQAFCCYGCMAVAQTIAGQGLSAYYAFRDSVGKRPDWLSEEALSQLNRYDDKEYQKQFVIFDAQTQTLEAQLMIRGLHCPACVWLIEKRLEQVPGVIKVSINLTTGRAILTWAGGQLKLSAIIEIIMKLGYQVTPDVYSEQNKQLSLEKQKALIRVGLAGLFMMQVMMLSVGLYLGDWFGIAVSHEQFIRWCLLVLTLPVLFVAGKPFFKSAYTALRNVHLNMDVPIVIALMLCFVASIWFTITQGKEVYFDSICMFIFFLSVSKFLEMNARYKLSAPFVSYQSLVPQTAVLCHDTQETVVSVSTLKVGDILFIKPGETIPADGIVIQGETSISESMLTGEPYPQFKTIGSKVYTGTQNTDQPIKIQISAIGANTLFSQMVRLLSKAATHKPKIVVLTNKVASWFVAFVLLMAALTLFIWWQSPINQIFKVVVSVLVITCPCALSLAIPTVVTCATYHLMHHGLLVLNNHLLEGLTRITDVVFDKTGTLTTGILSVAKYDLYQRDHEIDPRMIAYGLEQHSEHPVAKAIVSYCQPVANSIQLENIRTAVNQGVEGYIDGHCYRIGQKSFVLDESMADKEDVSIHDKFKSCYLSVDGQLLARFEFQDPLKENAEQLINYLKGKNITTHLLSGDPSMDPLRTGKSLKIDNIKHNASVKEKLNYINDLVEKQRFVLMVGDGMNDAPVLKASHVSIAVNSGTDLAKMSADGILISNELLDLISAFDIAFRAKRLIIQNISWAIGYNLVALPIAMFGFVLPYQAAIGMSVSSLAVVFNSIRLNRK